MPILRGMIGNVLNYRILFLFCKVNYLYCKSNVQMLFCKNKKLYCKSNTVLQFTYLNLLFQYILRGMLETREIPNQRIAMFHHQQRMDNWRLLKISPILWILLFNRQKCLDLWNWWKLEPSQLLLHNLEWLKRPNHRCNLHLWRNLLMIRSIQHLVWYWLKEYLVIGKRDSTLLSGNCMLCKMETRIGNVLN